MSEIFKTGLSIFLMSLAALIMSAVIAADTQAHSARKYADDVTKQIESSNFSDNVIDGCIQTADAVGYALEVEKITDWAGKTVMCRILLKYDYNIPVLNISTHHECRTFAR